MILLIDNYDSFSYNLYQLIGGITPDIRVIRNDEMTADEIMESEAISHYCKPRPRQTLRRRRVRRSNKDRRRKDTDTRRVPGSSGDLRDASAPR